MRYLDLGCNMNCWECSQECSIKEIMKISVLLLDIPMYEIGIEFQQNEFWVNSENVEKFFNYFVLKSLEPIAGMIISKGIDPNVVQQEFKETAVALYVARLKMIETQEQKE